MPRSQRPVLRRILCAAFTLALAAHAQTMPPAVDQTS